MRYADVVARSLIKPLAALVQPRSGAVAKLVRAFVIVAVSLGATLGAPAVPAGPVGSTLCGQGDDVYELSPFSPCKRKCYFGYNPFIGCDCMHIDPIIVVVNR